MHDPERQVLSRAAMLLVAISLVRWGVAARPSGSGSGPAQGDVLASHIAATSAATEEQERRGRPLEDGERIDPNVAVELDLDRLPGVGPSTAAAIVAARDTGIVFRRPDDLLAVRGIGPSTLSKIRPWLELRPAASPSREAGQGSDGRSAADASALPIDVNRADAEALLDLPGIGPALAARIVEARRERPFTSIRDLERVRGIGPSTVARLEAVAVAGVRR